MIETEMIAVDIGTPLRAELLAGKEVVATDFAVAYGFTRQGVSGLLKRMRTKGWIAKRSEKRPANGTTSMIWVWRCIDADALAAYVPKPYIVRRAIKRSCPFDALYAVWGIGAADIPLPKTTHEMRGAWA
jgi:hypothetical protein